MNEIQIKDLVDTNFRILTLLGYATALVMDYRNITDDSGNVKKCDWFLNSVNNVVYLSKPLPEFP